MDNIQLHLEKVFSLFALVALAPSTLRACEAEDTGATPPDAGRQLVGYRASLYPTPYPTERNNLNGEVWLASNEPGRPTGHLVRVRVRD